MWLLTLNECAGMIASGIYRDRKANARGEPFSG
jgi:hypothetical protein